MVRKSLDGLIFWASLLAVGCFHSPGESRKLEPVPTGDLIIPNWELVHRGRPLKAMDFSDDGTEGWAVGAEGIVIHFHNGAWELDTQASALATADLQSIWLSADGKSGWIVGSEGVVLHRNGMGVWKRVDPPAQQVLPSFVSVSSSGPSQEKACMVGSDLTLWCSEEGAIHQVTLGPITVTGPDQQILSRRNFRNTVVVTWTPDGRPSWAFWNSVQLRYESVAWLAERMPDSESIVAVASAWISPDESKGWAVGYGGRLWKLGEDGHWASASRTVLLSESLNDVAIKSDGSGGWAVGNNGVILGFNGENWSVVSPPHALTSEPLVSIWINAEGSKGWALSKSGRVMLSLRNGTWSSRAGFGTLTISDLASVWCDDPSAAWLQGYAANGMEIFRQGESGWELVRNIVPPNNYLFAANRDGTKAWSLDREAKSISFYDGLKWQARQLPDPNPGIYRGGIPFLGYLALSPDGNFGLLKKGSQLFQLRDGDWTLDTELKTGDGMWWKPASASGWVSLDSNQFLLFRDGKRIDFGSPLTLGIEEGIDWLLPTERGEGSLAKSVLEGQIFRFSGKEWEPVPDPFNPGEETPSDIWLSSDGRAGWIVGDEGGVWGLAGGRWLKDEQASALVPGKGLNSVCVARDGRSGWAVGETGKILLYAPKRIGAAQLVPDKGASLDKLQGSHLLRLPWELQNGERPEVRLIGVDGTESVPPHTIEPVDGSRKEFRLRFAGAAESLAKREEGRRHVLRVKVRLSHSLPVVAIFESEPILLHGLNAWQMVLLAGLGVTALNLLLFVSATRVRWIRTMVLHPVGSAAVGLLLGKYLLTDWLIRFVLPLKLAMFRDYRRRLGEESSLAEWKGRTYVPPQVSLTKGATERTRLPDEEDAWKAVFRELLRQPKGRLWLVVGPSGLGKTALLEQWTRMALDLGKTPFLIRLRNLPSPESEAAALMAQYGDVQVTPEVARDLMTSGGFILFLDGYNEDRSPEVTREFVRQAAQRNLVVMTSQFEPDWNQMLEIRKVYLEPFGRPQLCQILKEEWVDKVLASPYLADIARLPFTARLLAEFIDRNQDLPRSELEIYQDLRTGLDEGLLLNLEEAAWETFKTNETELSAGPKLPEEFCDAAVKSGVLTRRVRDGKISYRFRHERIHRLFVASYLERQDERPLEDWYKEVSPGLGRAYWTDVLDFRGQIKGRLAARDGDLERKAYRSYLRKVAGFSRAIFKDRLYLQYDRLSTAFPELNDQSFVRWAALVLAGAEPEQGSA